MSKPTREFNPLDPDTLANPYPVLKAWRECDPVHWNPELQRWMILEHKEILRVLKNPAASSRTRDPSQVPAFLRFFIQPMLDCVLRSMLFFDPPEHTRLRSMVARAFTPKIVSALQPKIEQITRDLLDAAAARGRMDIIADLSFPLPVIVISELLGVEVSKRNQFRRWSEAVTAIIVKPKPTVLDLWRANSSVKGLRRYFDQLFEQRRKQPREDLISQLLKESLTPDELFSMCVLILIAGHETTTNFIGVATLALLRNRQQFELLHRQPELIENAVEELLRYDSSVQAITRGAAENFEVGGKRILKGQSILLSLASANRDPATFQDPDRLDITRDGPGHASFGHGVHFCIGSALTRMEAKIALGELVRRFPDLRLESENLEWKVALAHRGLKRLDVVIGKSLA